MASAPPARSSARPHGSRIRQIGWMLALSLCLAAFLALTFKVNAVKSEVRLAERQIIALERQTLMLEVEFQTRASQRQLSQWNAVEFGYVAPRADQYLESERELAVLGLPRGLDAPDPIRVAKARPQAEEGLFADWLDDEEKSGDDEEGRLNASGYEAAGNLTQRLARSPALPSALADSGQ